MMRSVNKKGKVLAAVMLSLTLGMAAPAIQAAETQTVHEIRMASRKTTTTATEQTSSQTSAKKTKKEKKAEINKKKKKAKKYVGKKLSSLVRAVGRYKRLSKATSCYYQNEYDGIAKYDGFSVYCHTKGRKIWYVDSVE